MQKSRTASPCAAAPWALVLLSASTAGAVDVHWASAISGRLTDAAAWQGGVVPGAGDNAIIDAVGAPYTVDLGSARTIGGLSVASADAAVLVQGSSLNGQVTITVSGAVDVSAGTLTLISANQAFTSNLVAGTIAVGPAGTLRTDAGSGGTRLISGPILNDGLVEVLASTTLSTTNGVYANRGTLRVAQPLAIGGLSQALRLESGVLDIPPGGDVDLTSATLDIEGGTVVGVPRVRGSGALVIGALALGAADIIIGGATTLSGDIHAGQSVLVQGNNLTGQTTVTALTPVTVEGTLTLRSQDQAFQSRLDLAGQPLTIASTGVLSVEPGSAGDRFIFGDITNEGTFKIATPLTLPTAGMTLVNRGALTVTQALAISGPGARVQLEAGTLDAQATVITDAALVTMTGGTVVGQPILRGSSALVIDATAPGVAQFLLGGAAQLSGTVHVGQSVLIQGNNVTGQTTVAASGNIVVEGTLTLRSADQAFQSRLDLVGHALTVAAGGLLSVEPGSGGDRFVFGGVTNDGTIAVATPLTLPTASAAYINRGTWTATSALAISGAASTLALEAGVLDVSTGSALIDSTAVTMSGGTVSGRPVLRSSSLVIDAAANGAATFLLGNSTLGGTVHPLQDVLIQGNNLTGQTTTTASTDIIVQGLLTLRSANQAFQSRLNLVGHTLSIAAGGHLSVETGSSGDRFIFGDIDNSGTVDVTTSLTLPTAGARVTNQGTWNAPAALAINGVGNTLDLNSGVFTAGATVIDSATVGMHGGTVVGQPTLRSSALRIDAAATGVADFLLGGGCTLAGNISPAQRVLIQGNNVTGQTTVTAADAINVEGALTLVSANQAFQSRLDLAVFPLSIASGGHLTIDAGSGGDRFIFGNIENAGTIDVNSPLTLPTAATVFSSSGAIHVPSSLAISGAGETFVLAGGTLDVTGSMTVSGGNVVMNGGVVTGEPVLLSSALTIDPAATGAAAFLVGAASSIAGVIHASQSVLVQGNNSSGQTTVIVPTGLIVDGTLTMRSANQAFQSRVNVNSALPLVVGPTGTLLVDTGSGGDRFIFGNVDNNGRVEVDSPTQFQGGTLANNAGGLLAGTSTLNLNGTFTNVGAFAPGPLVGHGVLSVPLNAPVADLVVRLGGTAPGVSYDTLALGSATTLSGTLRVLADDGYLPTKGDVFTVLTAPAVASAFTAFDGLDLGTGVILNVVQNATNVQLVADTIPYFDVALTDPTSAPDRGAAFSITVTARDAQGAVDPAFVGAIGLSSTDGGATLPGGALAFGAADAGVRTFNGLVLRSAGPQQVNAIDVASPTHHGRLTVNIPGDTRITLGGFVEGSLVATPVRPTFTIDAVGTPTVTALLDGKAFQSGDLAGDGNHVVDVIASDGRGVAQAHGTFAVDTAPPRVRVTSIADGGIYAPGIAAGISVDDAHLDVVDILLDGLAYVDGTPVNGAGAHTLTVHAVDLVANTTDVRIDFTVDAGVPTIVVTGVDDGVTYTGAVSIAATSDDPAAVIVITLDGAPYAGGAITGEGKHDVVVTAENAAGGVARTELHFTIDGTPPSFVLTGIVDGGIYAAPVTPDVVVESADTASVRATLDGIDFTLGSTVAAPGAHELVLVIRDTAGNESRVVVRFTLDPTAPTVAITGVADGAYVNSDITLDIVVSGGALPAVGELTLDGAAYTPGTPIAAEGRHVVTGTARVTGVAAAVAGVTFTIDKTAPVITVGGVVDGELRGTAVQPSITIDDLFLADSAATLDGVPFVEGSSVVEEGDHVLAVSATDRAGNTQSLTLGFTVDTSAPVVVILAPTAGATVSAPLTPDVTVTDAHIGTLVLDVDGRVLGPADTLGGTIATTRGAHTLHAKAVDGAGNFAEASADFDVELPLGVRIVVTRQHAPALAHHVVLLHDDGSEVAESVDEQPRGNTGEDGTVTLQVRPGRYIARIEHVWQRFRTPAFDVPGGDVLFDIPDEPAYAAIQYVNPVASPRADEDGSPAHPFSSVSDALAGAAFGSLIKIAGGHVVGVVTLPRGVSLRGGHRADTWEFSPATEVTTLDGVTMSDGESELLDVTVRDSVGAGVSLDGDNLVRDVVVVGAGADGIHTISDSAGLIANVLVDGSAGSGLAVHGAGVSNTLAIENVTAAANAERGLVVTGVRGKRILATDNVLGDIDTGDGSAVDALSDGVVFAPGPLHDRYLAQVRGGQTADSAGVDAADVGAGSLDLRGRTTSVDGNADVGAADFGYHAWPVSPEIVVPPPPPPPAVDGGCACASGAPSSPANVVLPLAALFALWMSRRARPRRTFPTAVSTCALAVSVCALSACGFTFDRGDELVPGSVVGRALHADGGGIGALARVTVDGTTLVRRADADGRFVVQGLTAGSWVLHISDDSSGDGRPDRAAVRAVSVRSFVPAGASAPQLTAVLLGDIPLAGVVGVTGTAARTDGAAPSDLARAFVIRSAQDLSTDELAGVGRATLATDGSAEADVGVPASGAFALTGVAPGAFHVVAFDPGSAASGPAISAPVLVSATAGQTADVGALALAPVNGTRGIDVATAVSGAAVPAATSTTLTIVRAGGSRARETDIATVLTLTFSERLAADLPLGAWDVYVDIDASAQSPALHGVLLGQLAYPAASDASASSARLAWGPVALSAADPCAPVGDVDRDGDGVIGLPNPGDAPELWALCAEPCTLAGAALAAATCSAGGRVFDCDDDADGQPDVLEPGCVGACTGGDLDRDGTCDREDVDVPTCGDACVPVDAGVPDAGNDDAGTTDAGVFDAGTRLGCSASVTLPADGVVTGTLAAGGTDDVDACFDTGAPDAIFRLTTPGALTSLTATTLGSGFDTVLSVYDGACIGADVVGCNDDTSGATSTVNAQSVPAGDLFFVVEGYRGAVGDFRLELDGTWALGAACDPTLTSLTCPGGACGPDGTGGFACLPPRDCVDGIDADEDGAVDEDTCASPPVVTCPANLAVQVLSPVSLAGTATDDVRVASRRWSLVSAPLGSTVSVTGASTDNASFTPLLAGNYVLRYVAADDVGQLSACEVTVAAQTDDVFRVELLWNLDVQGGDPRDLDLHLLHPTAPTWFDPALDCFFENCRAGQLSWQFGAGPDPSPSLDLDARDGRGPENVNIKAPEDVTYRIGVHDFSDFGFGPTSALVNVFCFGQLVEVVGPVTLNVQADPTANDFWEVADVTFAAGACSVTPLEAQPGVPLVVPASQARVAR